MMLERSRPADAQFVQSCYIVMSFVVVPLSAAPGGFDIPPLPRLVQGVLIHIACVGLPIAFIARRLGSAVAPTSPTAFDTRTPGC